VNGTGLPGSASDCTDLHFKLTADIDLGGIDGSGNGVDSRKWTPIGVTVLFKGTFDGDGHTISGLYVFGGYFWAGLFGGIGDGGTVKNVRVEGRVEVDHGSDGGYADCYAGGIAGVNNGGTVQGCVFIGNVICTDEPRTDEDPLTGIVGGIVGSIGSDSDSVSGSVENCYHIGSVKSGKLAGGIAGESLGTVEHCYHSGTVTANSHHGGVVGQTNNSVINCYYLNCTGDGIGSITGEHATDSYAASLTADNFKNSGWDFTNTWVMGANGPELQVFFTPVTIKAKDASKSYDGSALTENGFTVSGQPSGDTHTFVVTMTADSTITDVGTQPNVIATVDGVAVTTGTQTVVDDYLVTTADGTLTVTKATQPAPEREPSEPFSQEFPSALTFDGGKLVISPENAGIRDTVTLKAIPDAGNELKSLTVTQKGVGAVKTVDKGGGVYTFAMPGGNVAIGAAFGAPEAQPAPQPAPQTPPAKPNAVLSPQKITVNGVEVTVEAYNIGGTNYFKLRDLAALLKGTPAQFDVGYDASRNAVVMTRGAAYDGAAATEFADNSASAVASPQTVELDGQAVDLTAYNIGGSNFFGLRELAAYLGYSVDYDEAANTAIIESR